MKDHHRGVFNGAYHLGSLAACPVCRRFGRGVAARQALNVTTTTAAILAASLPNVGHWQFLAASALVGIVMLADSRGWI